jgi:hypothetical protein
MFARLLMALRGNGASEGRPFLGTQALGIPWVAAVFLFLRVLLLAKPICAVHDESSWVELSEGFGRLQFLDIALLSVCIWVYAIDFFKDGLRWDALGFSMRSWQVLWVLFWGLLPFFGLLLVAPFITGLDMKVVLGAFRWAICGGLGYVLVQRIGGKVAAMLGPICIAFSFACALFWAVEFPFQLNLWWQGFLVFWLNVLLMQWFEQDKDSASKSTNVWLSFEVHILFVLAVLLACVAVLLWAMATPRGWGFLGLLLFYVLMVVWPSAWKPFRLYRLLIDGALVLWLL